MPKPANPIRVKTVALPVEHGGWGFLFEPVVLGLLVAPTVAGVCLGLAAVAGFLLETPLKIVVKNRNRLMAFRRYRMAGGMALVYATAGLAALTAAVVIRGWAPMIPLLVVSPLVIVYLFYDTQNKSRNVSPQLAGPVALAAAASSIAVAGGWPWPQAVSLWALVVARAVPSIIYVRARLRLERGETVDRLQVLSYHLAFLTIVALLAWRGLAPLVAIPGILVLMSRAVWGLSSYRRLTKTKHIGILELCMGLFYTLLVASGYWLGA